MEQTTQAVKWITCCNCGRQYAGAQCPFCQYRPFNFSDVLAEIFSMPPMPERLSVPSVPESDAMPINVPIRRIASYFEIEPAECCVPEFPCRECMIKADTDTFFAKEGVE